MINIEEITITVVTLKLDKDYLRFDSDCWYIHDKSTDTFVRVANDIIIEEIYNEAINSPN